MSSFWDVFWFEAKPNGKNRQFAIGAAIRDDIWRASTGRQDSPMMGNITQQAQRADKLRAAWEGGMENVYRVFINPATESIEVVCLGIDNIDSEAEGIYRDSTLLPVWMQERLAVLRIMKVDPPQTKIEGVGMRVDEHVFWIIKQ